MDPRKAKNATPVVETSDDWLTDERVVYGMHARQVNTGQLIRGFAFVFSLHWVVSSDTGHRRSWLMAFRARVEEFLHRGHSFLDPQ